MTRLDGRVCVVTGSSGMAADAARRFALEGALVVVIGREADECEALGLDHEIADLSDERATESAFAHVRERHGRIDALYAVAGGSGRARGDGPLHELTLAGWRATFDMNAVPTFLAAREAVRQMRAQAPSSGGVRGSVVLMSSVLAFDPAPALFATHAYAAAKAAVIGLMHSAAAYYATDRVRVNVLAPALVATPMSRRAADDQRSVEFSRRRQPLTDGFLDPADVTAAAVYLCSDESRAVTGQVVVVDGGWTSHPDDRIPSEQDQA